MIKNKKTIAVSLAIIFFIALDRFLKSFAFNNQFGQVNLLGEVLKFSYKSNYYIAFSLPLAGVWLNAVIVLIVLLLIFYWLKACRESRSAIAIYLFAVIAGAGSNFFDRLKYGFVVDYLDLKYFTVFNLADAIIVIGAVRLILLVKNYK